MRIGFIGGNGHHMLNIFAREEGGDVEAAFAGDGYDNDGAKQRAERWGITQWHDDPAAMLDQFKPDMVNIGAMYGHNGELIALALERGIAVLSDKPIAATWAQYEKLVDLTSKTDAPLITELPFRSLPGFVAAHDAVAQGIIGDVVLATGQKSYRFGDRPKWYADRDDYGGTILWVASHAIDFIRYVTGQTFTHVYGCGGNVAKPDYGSMEEFTVSVLRLEGGGAAVVHADYNRPAAATTHGDDRLRIVGGKGSLEIMEGKCTLITHDDPPCDITDRAQVDSPSQEMLNALQGKPSDRYGTKQSLEMAAVLLHARDAADTQTTIQL